MVDSDGGRVPCLGWRPGAMPRMAARCHASPTEKPAGPSQVKKGLCRLAIMMLPGEGPWLEW